MKHSAKTTNPVTMILSFIFLAIAAFGNPGMSEYENYEIRRFKGLESSIGNREKICSQNEEYSIGRKLIDKKDYQSICESVVSSYESNPERLLATINANTFRRNFILFSTYETNYFDIFTQIDKIAEQYPIYKSSRTGTATIETSDTSISAIIGRYPYPAIGAFGTFFDFRKWRNN